MCGVRVFFWERISAHARESSDAMRHVRGASFLVFISARDINKTDTGCSVLCAPTYQREYSNTDVTCMSMSVLWRISYKLGLGAAFCGHSLPKTSDQGNIMSA